jgi:(1->4)-alpha-D-glucan 1-alpha-D-glucosylmutase
VKNGFSTPKCLKVVRATYRLQFHEGFRLSDALAIVPYLSELGISHVFASPLTKACAHSTHGYDVCDHQELNPELGTEADLEQLIAVLREHKMGLVLDIVPNHMAASLENPWWKDVLTRGRESAFAACFDIDWESSDFQKRGKVLLPVLREPYQELLAGRQIKLQTGDGGHWLCYAGLKFPVASGSFPGGDLKQINEDVGAMDDLVKRQNYRLVFWKQGDGELNYRRFFNITSLAGLRVEDLKVFDDSHKLVRAWMQKGWLDGLRVDHPDGLRDPARYLRRLRDMAPNAWIVVEKILEPGEPLPQNWPVAGTTGYDFLNQVNSIFIQAKNEGTMTRFYSDFTSERIDCGNLVRDKKRAALDGMFQAEICRLLKILAQIATQNQRWREFSIEGLREATEELAACFPVYRIYGTDQNGSVNSEECQRVDEAIKLAIDNKPQLPPEVFEMLKNLLVERGRGTLEDEFAGRFQQLTGPAMAKGKEDSAFYCFNRLISLNEVGGDPGQFGSTVEAFHGFCATLQGDWPDSMLATSSHDTKRGEDVRTRLDVLSEIPDQWCAAVRRWAGMNQSCHTGRFPDRNTEYFIYQTLVGAWPVSEERLQACMEKAVKEAGQITSWKEPDVAYESAVRNFISGILKQSGFIADLEKFVFHVSEAGHVNSLSQTLIKLTAPGIPDIYQGCELWNLSVVDPDNRRPVDFESRRRLLAKAKTLSAEEIWNQDCEPLAKLWLIWKALNFRAACPGRFAGNVGYEPISADGIKQDHVIAFMRGKDVITIVQRLPLTLQDDWADTSVFLPEGKWSDELTGEIFYGPVVYLKQLLAKFPVALLVSKDK